MPELPAILFQNVTKQFSYRPGQNQTVLETLISLVSRRRPVPGSDRLVAVDNVSFAVMPGETLGLIGRNGGGKSTILKLATRVLQPNSGRVYLNGRASALLELGAGFHADLTGRENIFLNGSLLGLSRDEIKENFDDIVEFSELDEFIDMPVKHYSSGMYMRLGFSIAVHVHPDILFVDEILAVGDQAFQSKCIDRIYDIKRGGTTIIMVSHDLRMMRNLCSRLIWVDHGRLLADGDPGQVINEYSGYARELEFKQQARRQRDNEPFKRWGSGEVEITGVQLLDGAGQPQQVFQTGDPVTIAIDFEARETIPAPLISLAIFREDGIQISGPNNQQDGFKIDQLTGRDRIFYRIASLPLLPASYEISVAVHNTQGLQAYDYHDRAYPFTVIGSSLSEFAGLVELPAGWARQNDK